MKNILLILTLICLQWIPAQNVDLSVLISKNNVVKHYKITTSSFCFVIGDSGVIESFYPLNSENDYTYYNDTAFDKSDYGKVKSIGQNDVKYWEDSFTNKGKIGKLKSIGDIKVDYWDNAVFDKDKFMKVKSIGTIAIDYYDNRISDEKNYRKIKTIGNFEIRYFDSPAFDKSRYGMIKSVGNAKFDYYDEITNNNLTGKLKSVQGKTPYLSLEFE